MKASEIVQQLAAVLPKHTDAFTKNLVLVSLTQVGGVATATTAAAHGLGVSEQANITGAQNPLSVSSLTRSGVIGTVVTDDAHDFTEGFSPSIELDNATEAEFNGSFTILTVPDRNTVTFTMPDSGDTTASGGPEVLNGANVFNQFNGLREITSVPSTTTFTFAVPATLAATARGTPEARSLPRISAVVSEDIVIDAYTKQPQDDLWAFVVLGDVVASKSRHIDSDGVDNIQRGQFFRQQIIQPVTIYVVVPSALESAARGARDFCEELLLPLSRSVLFKAFDSGLSVGAKGPLQFTGHGFAAYHRAWYMHAFEFQQTVDMTFADTVGYDEDVAFRDIRLEMGITPGTGEEILTAGINLDGSTV